MAFISIRNNNIVITRLTAEICQHGDMIKKKSDVASNPQVSQADLVSDCCTALLNPGSTVYGVHRKLERQM